jgi:hypothetical protein
VVVVGGILQDVKEVSISLVEQTYKVTEINKNKTKYNLTLTIKPTRCTNFSNLFLE